MADEEVQVEVTVPVEDPDETSHDETIAPATDHVIDAAVESGVAASEATDAANGAHNSALDANLAASEATEAAERVETEVERLDRITSNLVRVAELNAAAATANSADNTADTLQDLDEPEADPTVDVKPDSTHWLEKRWFGKKTRVSE